MFKLRIRRQKWISLLLVFTFLIGCFGFSGSYPAVSHAGGNETVFTADRTEVTTDDYQLELQPPVNPDEVEDSSDVVENETNEDGRENLLVENTEAAEEPISTEDESYSPIDGVTNYVDEENQLLGLGEVKAKQEIEVKSVEIVSPEFNVSNTKTTAYYDEPITFKAEIRDSNNNVIEELTEGVTWEYKSSESSMASSDDAIKITEDGGTSIEVTPLDLDLTFKKPWNISYLHMTASYGEKEGNVTISINASKGLTTDKETVEPGGDIISILETAKSSVGNKAKIILKKDGETVEGIKAQEVTIEEYKEGGKAEATFTIPEDLEEGTYTLEAIAVGAPPLVLGTTDFEVTKEIIKPAELTNIRIWEPKGYNLRQPYKKDPGHPYAPFHNFFYDSDKVRNYEFEVDERVDKVGIDCVINQQSDTKVTYKVNGEHKGEAITDTKGGRVNYEVVELPIGKTTIEYIVNEGQVDEGIYTFVIHRKKTAMLDNLEITNLIKYPEGHKEKNYEFDKFEWKYRPRAINEEVEITASAQEGYLITYAVYDGENLESQGKVEDDPLNISLEKDYNKRKTVFFYVKSAEEDILPSKYEIEIGVTYPMDRFYLPLDGIKVENVEGDFVYSEEDIGKIKYGIPNIKYYTLKVKDDAKPIKITPFFGDNNKISYYIGDDTENTKTISKSGQEIIINEFDGDGKQKLTIKTEPAEDDYWHRAFTYYFQLEQVNAIAKELSDISIDGTVNKFIFDPELREYNIITQEEVIELDIASEEGDKVYYSIDESDEVEIVEGKITISMDSGEIKKVTLKVEPSEDNHTYTEGIYTLNFIRKDKKTKNVDQLLAPILFHYFADDYNHLEWSLMSMASLGYKDKIDEEGYINGQAANVATTTRETDFAKAAINLMALGYSAEDLTTFSAKGKTVNLIDQSVRVSKNIIDATDINAMFNTNTFPVLWASSNPSYRAKFNEIANQKEKANISDLVKVTVKSQRADGSFPVIGDIDGVAMVLQGLAPYYKPNEPNNLVTIAVNKGLRYLSGRQDKDKGTFDLKGMGDSGTISSESVSMVIVALSALGIDANSDPRFLTRDGKGLVDVLEENFITEEGLFCHIIEKDGSKISNGMATEQGFRALASYKGFLVKGGTFNIYSAEDHLEEPCIIFPDVLLRQTIDYIQSLTKEDYELEGWEKLQRVLVKALEIEKNPDATYEEINSVVQELVSAYQRLVPKREFGGYVTISVEKFTLGQGYIKEPIKVPFNEGDNVAKLITDLLGEGKYKNTGSISSSFYLESVYDNDTSEINIPQYILDEAKKIDSRQDSEWLGQFDYTSESGWMYTANNEFLNVGMSDYTVKDGDVIRVQFTVCGIGADLGGGWGEGYIKPANKDKLTAKIAEINSDDNKESLLSKELVKTAYDKAYEILKNMESSQDSVDKALAQINDVLEKSEEERNFKVNLVNTPDNFKLGKDADVTAEATNNSDQAQDVLLIIVLYDDQKMMLNYSYSAKNVAPNTTEQLTSGFRIPMEGNYQVKAFVWENWGSIKPLSNVSVIPVQ